MRSGSRGAEWHSPVAGGKDDLALSNNAFDDRAFSLPVLLAQLPHFAPPFSALFAPHLAARELLGPLLYLILDFLCDLATV